MTKNSGSVRKSVLIPLPSTDFDPTEAAIPYITLKHYDIVFATPDGKVSEGDQRMIDGNGLGLFAGMLKAEDSAIKAYNEMKGSYVFQHPISYKQIESSKYDAIILPGGHAPGMKPYLESKIIQEAVREMNSQGKIIAAICHGVLIAARAGALRSKKVTALPKRSELLAWHLTKKRLGDYYRTYADTTVEEEVKTHLEDANNFLPGPPTFFRDSFTKQWPGFVVRDGNLVTARWPGDAHKFSLEIKEMLKNRDQE